MVSKDSRLKALDTLLEARMQHTKWVCEVVQVENPQVEDDHRKCDFGKWLLSACSELKALKEFQELDKPHRELHEAYKLFRGVPDLAYHPDEIKYLSNMLIDRIDLLEKRLRKPIQP